MLKERGPAEVVPGPGGLGRRGSIDRDPEFEHHRLEAAGPIRRSTSPEPGLLREVLDARDPRVRAAAARVVQFWAGGCPIPRRCLAATDRG